MARVSTLALLAGLLLPGLAAAADPGEVVFSELMIRSSSSAEWIELFNTTASDQVMDGCTIEDAAGTVALDGLTIPADGYVVLSRTESCISFDSGGDCLRPSDLVYTGLGLDDSGNEDLELACGGTTVDEVTVDWDDVEDDCVGAPTCSVQVAPEELTAAGNDSFPGNWCVPSATIFTFDTLGREMAATPGEPNVCPAAGALCGPGDVVFTELMLAPPTSTREWFEVSVVRGAGCDLHDCVLREGPSADPLTPPEDGWGEHTIDAPGNSLFVAFDSYALFAKSADTVVGDLDDPEETDIVLADYRYGTSIGFSNSEEGWLHLLCADALVDSVPFDWTRFSPSCPQGGCSVNLLPSAETAEGNDDLSNFCLPPDDRVRPSSTGEPMTATPGEPGLCQQRAWPGPGQVMFTEIQGKPNSGSTGTAVPEFFELLNRGESDADLVGCRITRERLDRESGQYAPTSTSSEAVFGDEAEPATLGAGQAQVFSRTLCLDGTDPEIQSCTGDELIYTGLQFTATERERLELLCPDGQGGEILIDRAEYDFDRSGIRSGHSVEFDPNEPDAVSLNDEPSEWCEAAFIDCYVTNGEGVCNFGTPGVAGECKTSQQVAVQSGVPGCRCDVTAPTGSGWFAAALVGLLGRRRKRK